MKYAVIYTQARGGHTRSYERKILEFITKQDMIDWHAANKNTPSYSKIKYIGYQELQIELKAEITEIPEAPIARPPDFFRDDPIYDTLPRL